MTGKRVAGGLIDRARVLRFTFDGQALEGFGGDTLTSALLANGVRVVGRSFKYHRPRGVWGAWVDDPNAICDVTLGSTRYPNVHGATTTLADGMDLRSVNAWPSASRDIKGGLDLLNRWLGAGFYYKTFMWPNWHLYEPGIRAMAGLGQVSGDAPDDFVSDQVHAQCSVLIVGGGAAGLVAARAAAEAGRDVVLVDDHAEFGGGLYRLAEIEGAAPKEWVADHIGAIRAAGGRILPNTTAFGVYDHNLVALSETKALGQAPRLWRLRPKQVILATGALDRPLTFANNDIPGAMSLNGAAEYLARYGVLVGDRIAVAADHPFAAAMTDNLRNAGAEVFDVAPSAQLKAIGRKSLRAVEADGKQRQADTLLMSAGWTPLVHLWRHAGGKLIWDEARAAFLPGDGPEGFAVIGAAAGHYEMATALEDARAVATGGHRPEHADIHMPAHWPQPEGRGRHWIDLQHDVTLKDIRTAAQENYTSVEHLKRYTTLGMAVDQGKTSNMAGLAAMAAIQGKTIPEVGTTTFRPPYVPIPFESYRGPVHRGQGVHPLKRLPLETAHRQAGAAMGEYGGWLRPGWYGEAAPEVSAQSEARTAREAVGLFDASPLGKIEVMGPDAAPFLNFIYYNTVANLRPGKIRYGFMLTEKGVVFDDGVIARLGPEHFLISCSSSHADAVVMHLEAWRQDGNDPDRIFIHDLTHAWATLAVTGPKARDLVAGLGCDVDLSADAFPHMSLRTTQWQNHRARITRVSFTGDLSFEISVNPAQAGALWSCLYEASAAVGGGPIGIEALSILRAEKGFIMVGKDTDGETMPHDLGFDIPRQKKKKAFLGDRALHTPVAVDPDRRVLIGLRVADGASPLATGAHLVTSGPDPKSIGVVTSSYASPSLGRPIALATLERGRTRIGDRVLVWHLGATCEAWVTDPCAFDPDGERLHA